MYKFIRKLARGFERLGDRMTPARCIVLVFLAVIAIGTGLLSLPAASRTGQSCDFMTAFFTATSATCVTGLTVVDTYAHWSLFGQLVILVLMQIGGLGFMSILTVFFFMMRTRIGLKKRLLMAESMGLDSLEGIVRLIRMVLRGTVLLEGMGALILTLRFWVDLPLGQALWMGIFHAVSAFCNAGFHLMGRFGENLDLAAYIADPVVNGVLMVLIVIGGIGFFVWRDVVHQKWNWKRLSVYSRLAILISGLLLLLGWVLFAIFEWNNPATIGNLTPWEKALASLFQSVNTRAAGFTCFGQGDMTEPAKAISIIWMLIGGSSGSTAGGIKTVTVGIVFLAALQAIRGKRYVTVFHRTVAQSQINSAMAIVMLILFMTLAGSVILGAWEQVPMLDAVCEVVSALGTGGMSTGLTAALSGIMKWMLICLMFFGRVGIMTIGVGLMMSDRAEDRYRYAETKLLIG